MRRRLRSDDRGAVAVIVVVLFASMVLFGMGALAIDTGQFYAEKAQLQNGADGGVVAVAQTCANGHCNVATDLTPVAQAYANKNANDSASAVEYICGQEKSGVLVNCVAGNLCPDPPKSGNWVDVQVSTRTSDGKTILPPIFGQAVLGKAYKGQIHACAQAEWGPPGGGTGLALTMSVCDWLADTGSTVAGDPNAKYATPEPPYPQPAAPFWPLPYPGTVTKKTPAVPNVGGENVVQVHGSGKCGAGMSGLDVPGGFGWLSDDPTGKMPLNCEVKTDANGYVYENPGGIGGGSSDCATKLKAIYNASKGHTIPNSLNPIFIPVFDLACNSSGKLMPGGTVDCPTGMPRGSFHIAGYAQFVLTGVDYSPVNLASLINGAHPCTGSFSCLYGMFTDKLIPVPPDQQICTGTCPDFGPVIVKLIG